MEESSRRPDCHLAGKLLCHAQFHEQKFSAQFLATQNVCYNINFHQIKRWYYAKSIYTAAYSSWPWLVIYNGPQSSSDVYSGIPPLSTVLMGAVRVSREIRYMMVLAPGVFEVINVRYFWIRVRTFQFSTVGENISRSRPAINRPLTGRTRRGTARFIG